jgi:metal-responsive CopG/Arc/MetJ family transcriptional regulator
MAKAKKKGTYTMRLPDDLIEELDAWRAEMRYPPTRTDAVIDAIRRMLKEESGKGEGFDPQKPSDDVAE